MPVLEVWFDLDGTTYQPACCPPVVFELASFNINFHPRIILDLYGIQIDPNTYLFQVLPPVGLVEVIALFSSMENLKLGGTLTRRPLDSATEILTAYQTWFSISLFPVVSLFDTQLSKAAALANITSGNHKLLIDNSAFEMTDLSDWQELLKDMPAATVPILAGYVFESFTKLQLDLIKLNRLILANNPPGSSIG